MMVAQQLYEGVDLREHRTIGLITYEDGLAPHFRGGRRGRTGSDTQLVRG